MKIFDKGTIEGFAYGVDTGIAENSMSELFCVVKFAMDDLRKNNPFISENFELFPVNEFWSGAVSSQSELNVLLALNSPQLELNSIKLTQNKLINLKNKLKHALWVQKSLKSKKKKKEKYFSEENNINQENIAKYNIVNFQKDLFFRIVNYVPKTSVVSLRNGVLSLKGEDFPFKVNIFPVINKHGSYNYYLPYKNKFINIDFRKRFENIEQLVSTHGKRYFELLRVFNSVGFNLRGEALNPIFIESLIFNIPNLIFKKNNIYEIYLSSLNFFNNKNIFNFKSICEEEISIKDEKLVETAPDEFYKILKQIKKYS